MALKQISVFVPNETGSLEKLVNILAEAGVDMRAMSMTLPRVMNFLNSAKKFFMRILLFCISAPRERFFCD